MNKWEYYRTYTFSDVCIMGISGWELVSVVVEYGETAYYLKRKKS